MNPTEFGSKVADVFIEQMENRVTYIENVSWDDVKHGWHTDMGDRAILIQIADPATFFPDPKNKFFWSYKFEFLDAEDSDVERFGEEPLFSDSQAEEIVGILRAALRENRNVLVHCHAGICRSGAVVEVASMMGFTPTNRYRQPNLRVKHKLMKQMGWTYDSEEQISSAGGTISAGGILMPYTEYLDLPTKGPSASGNEVPF